MTIDVELGGTDPQPEYDPQFDCSEGSRSGRFPMETFPAPELRPGTTRLRVEGIPSMADRLGLRSRKPEPDHFREPYATITISVCPTVWDPLDLAPIFISPEGVNLAARGVFARLAVWYLRRYVLAICRGKK
jgi:hypothetical protein